MSEPAKNCAECLYGETLGDGSGPMLECHRHAPVVAVNTTPSGTCFSETVWPQVSAGDWCGDGVAV